MKVERKLWAWVCLSLGILALGMDARWVDAVERGRAFVVTCFGTELGWAGAERAVDLARRFAPGVGGLSLGDPVALLGWAWLLGLLALGWKWGRWMGSVALVFALSPWMPWFVMGRSPMMAGAYLGVRDLSFGMGAGLALFGALRLGWFKFLERRGELVHGSRSLVAAVFFSVAAPLFISEVALDGEPLTNDGIAYRFQAELFADGEVVRDMGPLADFFPARQILPGALATSKYPPGHSALLAAGETLGNQRLIPLLLAGLATLLIFHLARRLGSQAPVLCAWIFALSPMVIGVNSLWLSHGTSLPMVLIFMVCWLSAWDERKPTAPMLAILAGLALSLAFAARPLTALAVAVPFMVAGLVGLDKRRGLLVLCSIVGFIPGLMLFLGVNEVVTGSWWQPVYSLYAERVSPNDRWGLINLATAAPFTLYNLARLSVWLLGAGSSIALLAYGWRAARPGKHAHLTWSVALSLLVFYGLHRFQGVPWAGPLYLVEAVPLLVVLGGGGVVALASRLRVPNALLLVAMGLASLGLLAPHMEVARGEAQLRRAPRIAALELREKLGRDVLLFVPIRNGAEQKRFALVPPKLTANGQSGRLEAAGGVVLAKDLGGQRNGQLVALFGGLEVRIWNGTECVELDSNKGF